MDPCEYPLESGRRNKATTRWTHRSPDVPVPIGDCEAIPYPLQLFDGHLMSGHASTSMGPHYVPQPTSFESLHYNQQASHSAGHIQAQVPVLLEGVQEEFAEEDLRHAVACWEIQNKAHTVSAIVNPTETATRDSYAATRKTATGYTAACDVSMVPAYPARMPDHGFTSDQSSSGYELDVDPWSGQQSAETIIHPNALLDHVQDFGQQDNPFFNFQNIDYDAFDNSACDQRPHFCQMALTTTQHNTTPSMLSAGNNTSHYRTLLAPAAPPSAPPSLQQHDSQPGLVTSSEVPIYTTNRSISDMAAPPAGFPWSRHIAPFTDSSLTVARPIPPPSPGFDHSKASHLDIPSIILPSMPAEGSRGLISHRKRKLIISNGDDESGSRSGRAVDNIQFHTNPDADRQRRQSQPKRRRVTEKTSFSCFGCRFSRRKCEISVHGICLRCQNILKKYSHYTAVPKFTCNVRTKFSEMSIYTDLPTSLPIADIELKLQSSLSRPIRIDWDDGDPLVTIGVSATVDFAAAKSVVVRLLSRVRSLIDMLEPWNPRQYHFKGYHECFFSYSVSIVRWKRAICFFWPDLKDALDFQGMFHRCYQQFCLRKLDSLLFSRRNDEAVWWLNALYEEISSMEHTTTTNVSAKEHLLSSITQHLLHLYRVMFPAVTANVVRTPAVHKQLDLLYNLFPETSELLPETFRLGLPDYLVGDAVRHKLQLHKLPLIPLPEPRDSRHDASSRELVCDRCKRPSALKAYVPASHVAFFGLEKEDVDNFESLIQKILLKIKTPYPNAALDVSPWTLSISLKAYFDQPDLESASSMSRSMIFWCVAEVSLQIWEAFMHSPIQDALANHTECEVETPLWNMEESIIIGSFARSPKGAVYEWARRWVQDYMELDIMESSDCEDSESEG